MVQKVICPYCGREAELVDDTKVYGSNGFGSQVYLCQKCNAYVGVHKGSKQPLGTLANRELRIARKAAHLVFDDLWKSRKMGRWQAYRWLAETMHIDGKDAHIGMFNIDQCIQLINMRFKE